MITPPPGWTIERTRDGLLIAPPGQGERAILRYRERLRPVRPALELVAAAPRPADFVATQTTAPKRLVTIEGEHAALVTIEGTHAGAPAVLAYGYVFLDDHYAALEGVVPPELVATVEQLVVGDVHLLGRVRRRKFMYAAPPGWTVEGDAFEARWAPPDGSARILVNPALPRTPGLVAQIVDKLAAGAVAPSRIVTRSGLEGEHYQLADTDLYFLADADFLYSVRGDRARDAAAALVDSIEPVPRPAGAGGDALKFWAD
ncbi:MAG: hypothetical protein ACM31C_30760 [Acidobacteriota bacterium]